jgi:outer membrane protein TolC
MYEAGLAEQTDVDQLSIQVNMLQNNLRSMERGLKMVRSMMKFQLGLDYTTEIELTEDLDQILEKLNPTAPVGAFNVENNIMFQLSKTQVDITEKMVDIERWSYAPTITGFYTYNQKLLTTGFDMTPNNMAGITMNLPIFQSGSRKFKISQARIELDKAELSNLMVKEQLELQQQQLEYDLLTAIENYETQKENVEIAKRVFDNVQNKYEQGMVSSLELTQTNNNYIQAESNFIQSIMSLLQARLAIDKLYNQL